MFGPLPPLRLVYFSSIPSDFTNMVAGALQQGGAEILLMVVTPGPSARPNENYKDVVAHKLPGVDILVTSHPKRLAPMLRELKPDLIFVTGFPYRLPAELLSLPRLGCINTHPAALPRYRGPNPIFWQVMNGEPDLGVTVHLMDPEFDTGPILAQATTPIDPDWYIEDMQEPLGRIAAQAISEGFAAALHGEPGRPQPTEGASYAPLTTDADRQIDWTRSATQIRNQIRAWGAEGTFAKIDGRDWVVRRARVVEDSGARSAPVGSLLDLGSAGRAVQTADGLLLFEDAAPLSAEEAQAS